MEKIYNPRDIEQPLYKSWEEKGYFSPSNNVNKDNFCIMMPPPNITGYLHMGHAFQQTVIDIIVRYQRMLGKNTLWQGGMDHAGIATQMVVENKISVEEGKTRYDYGRDSFINKIWNWKKKSSDAIAYQMRRLGISVDWNRDRFTMDKAFSEAVKEAFVRLYDEGLIYRNKRLVNWDSKLHTVVSDLEIEKRELKSFMWYIRYPLENYIQHKHAKKYLVVATTRPETLLGDTAIAVHPEDSRYKDLIGEFVIVPLVNRRIPIIGDKNVNAKKNTGCIKVTPAHDFNDYEIGQRHQLPMINILTFDGNIRESTEIFDTKGNKSNAYSTDIPPNFQKLKSSVAREVLLTNLDSFGLLEKVESHKLTIPYSDRGGVIIEPMLTDQWYLRTNILAKSAIAAVKAGKIKFVPKQYENMYFSWMYNMRDWCISRQLWWGHRIPVWYDGKGNAYAGRSENEIRKNHSFLEHMYLKQDEDVLDTWFSSALWTFATLGWPKNTDALHRFHPTNIIVSGFDIISFWIARMIMMTMHFVKDNSGQPQVPFKKVYITGLIRDEKGQKMSKSKGNVMDPIDMVDGISLSKLLKKRTLNMMQPNLIKTICQRTKKQFPNGIESHGVDALRFTLTALASTSRDINWDMKRLIGYRNFCNKLWNASIFILKNTENKDCGFTNGEKVLSLADRWILSELHKTIKSYRESLDNFRFDIAANILYQFFWNKLCDWYIELTKSIINSGSEIELRGTRNTLIVVLEAFLRLAHPIIPFITEYIWKNIKHIAGIRSDTIMLQPFPQFNENFLDEEAYLSIDLLKKITITIRNVRSELNISPKRPLKLLLRDFSDQKVCHLNYNLLKTIACLESVSILLADEIPPVSVTKIIDGGTLMIPIKGVIDKFSELQRLEKEITRLETKIKKIEAKLLNKNFIFNASKEVINKENEKFFTFIEVKKKLIEQKLTISAL